ncbi:hypothetical protein PINS_up023565 [Pythium insidiosum]|nr:hypothetical protein PINS_up023565 [Pythium insidiosum]
MTITSATDLPDTLLLKDLGYKDLVMAIRKKHGGFGAVATKMGHSPPMPHGSAGSNASLMRRANRRRKRQIRVEQHDFY